MPDQLSLFGDACPTCSAVRVLSPAAVAPTELWALADGRALLLLWDGRRASVWIELSESLRRWLAAELVKGLDATTGCTAESSPLSEPNPDTNTSTKGGTRRE